MSTPFTPTWLYIKRHKITGLLYFGKTIKNPHTYLGSGRHWVLHCAKHDRRLVETVWAERFDCRDTLVDFAMFFSDFADIVASPRWANLKGENGLDGGGPGPSSEKMKAVMNDPAVRLRCSIAKSGKPGSRHTEASKAKIGEAQKNLTEGQRLNKSLAKIGEKNGMADKSFFNNGLISKAFVPGHEPDGWVRGRLFKHQS
jgi:hypothetical protein